MNTLNFIFNFNAPVGQNIAHVDKLEAHFDKDMTMQVMDTASPHPKARKRDSSGEINLSSSQPTLLSRRPEERGLQTSLDALLTASAPEERGVPTSLDTTPLPEVLCSDEARDLHARLCEAGMVDEAWQPVGLSFTEKGTLIDYVAERLDIRAKWKLFGALWHVDPETLRTSKARGLDQDKTWAFRSRLEAL